jgi:tetratricopeptide (TPR) repeat protein
MTRWQHLAAAALAFLTLAMAAPGARAEGEGQADLDEALRIKVIADGGLGELNQVIELLESALEKGLDIENSDFAEQVLSESLLERAVQLAELIKSIPKQYLADPRVQQRRAMAVSDLRRVIDYDNPPPQATALLAELLALPGGDAEEAFELLEELTESGAFEELPPVEQAEILVQRAALQSDADKALADFARAIELAPDKTEYRLSRAEFLFEQGDSDEALEDVREFVETHPQELEAHVLLAQIQRALKRYDEAIASLDRASEIDPESPAPHQFRGEIYREMEKYDEAIAAFTRVLDIQPGLDLALIRRAEAYFFAGKLDEALADVEAVLRENPGMALAHGLRAQVLASKDRLGEAIAEMKLLADALPGQPDVHMQLALYFALNDQPQEAIAEYTAAIELDGNHFLALRSRGDAYLSVGDHGAAVADFDRALVIEPADSSLLNNFAWVLATSPDDHVRDGSRAIKLATEACSLTDYRAPHILSTLAAAYAETGDFDSAREWSQKAVDMDDEEHDEQLAAELASYMDNKPWRERQAVDSTPDARDELPGDNDQSGENDVPDDNDLPSDNDLPDADDALPDDNGKAPDAPPVPDEDEESPSEPDEDALKSDEAPPAPEDP